MKAEVEVEVEAWVPAMDTLAGKPMEDVAELEGVSEWVGVFKSIRSLLVCVDGMFKTGGGKERYCGTLKVTPGNE